MFYYLNVPIGKACRLSRLTTLDEIVGVRIPALKKNTIVVIFKKTADGIRMSVTNADHTFHGVDLINEKEWVGKGCHCYLLRTKNSESVFNMKTLAMLNKLDNIHFEGVAEDKTEIYIELDQLENFDLEGSLCDAVSKSLFSDGVKQIVRHPKEFEFNTFYPFKLLIDSSHKSTPVIFDGRRWVDIPEKDYHYENRYPEKPIKEDRRFDMTYHDMTARVISGCVKDGTLPDCYELQPREFLTLIEPGSLTRFDFNIAIEQTVNHLSLSACSPEERKILAEIICIVGKNENIYDEITTLARNNQVLFDTGNLSLFKSCITLQEYVEKYRVRSFSLESLKEKATPLLAKLTSALTNDINEQTCDCLRELHSTCIIYFDRSNYQKEFAEIFKLLKSLSDKGSKHFSKKEFGDALPYFRNALTLSLILYTYCDPDLGSAHHNYAATCHEVWIATGKINKLYDAYEYLKTAEEIRKLTNQDDLLFSTQRRLREIKQAVLLIDQSFLIEKSIEHLKLILDKNKIPAALRFCNQIISFTKRAMPPDLSMKYKLHIAIATQFFYSWKKNQDDSLKDQLQHYCNVAIEVAEKRENQGEIDEAKQLLQLFNDTVFVKKSLQLLLLKGCVPSNHHSEKSPATTAGKVEGFWFVQ